MPLPRFQLHGETYVRTRVFPLYIELVHTTTGKVHRLAPEDSAKLIPLPSIDRPLVHGVKSFLDRGKDFIQALQTLRAETFLKGRRKAAKPRSKKEKPEGSEKNTELETPHKTPRTRKPRTPKAIVLPPHLQALPPELQAQIIASLKKC